MKGLGHPSGKESSSGLGSEGVCAKLLQARLVALASRVAMEPQPFPQTGLMCHRKSSGCAIQELCSKPPRVSDYVFVFSTAHFSAKEAGDLSTLFDVGGIIGEALSFCPGMLSFCLLLCRGTERRDSWP